MITFFSSFNLNYRLFIAFQQRKTQIENRLSKLVLALELKLIMIKNISYYFI